MNFFYKISGFIAIIFLLASAPLQAQVAITDTFTAPSPDNSAVLDLQSFERGFLPPRMNQTQRDGINSPADGLMIFNTSTQCAEIFIQGAWKIIACACSVAPSTPGSVTGYGTVCPNQTGVTYSVSFDPNADSYSWTVPPGASITAGQGTNSVTVDFGTNSGNVSVTASNACGTSGTQTLPVSVQIADASYSFSPTSGINIGNPVNFSALNGGQTYAWTFPSGTPATSSSQSQSVSWAVGASYNVVLVATVNAGCVDSDTQTITVNNCPSQTVTFNYTGSMQTYTVPSCVDSMHIQVWGAEGGDGAIATGSVANIGFGGEGGFSEGYITAAGGTTLNIYVGGQGSAPTGGFNGGGLGGTGAGSSSWGAGGGGGGASDVRIGGTALSNRIIVAGGGGGGGGREGSFTSGDGGAGGGTSGTAGARCQGNSSGYGEGGQGGTQGAGGSRGCFTGSGNTHCGTNGSLGQGGIGANSNSEGGGAGGGGYFGGGGGGDWGGGGGGGGGSGYIGGVNGGNMVNGGRTGNGQVIISW